MIQDYIRLSFNSLKQRRLRSWLTMIGIFIGIAAVISLIGLGEGLRTAISSQFGFLGPDVFSVRASGLDFAGPPGAGAVEPLSDELADKIKDISGVDTAFNRNIETGIMEFNGKQDIAFAVSVASGTNRKVIETILNAKTQEGRLLKDGDTRKVVLGNSFSEESDFGRPVRVGDTVVFKGTEFEVVGILEKKGSFIIDGSILVNDEVVLQNWRKDGTTDIIAVRVDDVDQIDKVKRDVERLLRKERNVKEGEENFVVQSAQQALESLNSTLFAIQLFVYIIASISLAVGGIGIMNTMYTAVLERTKEIGVMKAIGARNSGIFRLFFIESGFLGMVGGLIGVFLGLLLAHGFAFIGRKALGAELIQADVSIELILGALAFSFILGTLFGVLPAIQAAKMKPVDALRSR